MGCLKYAVKTSKLILSFFFSLPLLHLLELSQYFQGLIPYLSTELKKKIILERERETQNLDTKISNKTHKGI